MIAAIKIGRPIRPKEVVHHIDGNHSNNDPNNLVVLSKSEHARQHQIGKKPSAKTRAKLSKAKQGSTLPKNVRKKIEEANRRRWEQMTPDQRTTQVNAMVQSNIGRPCSSETRRKISEAKTK